MAAKTISNSQKKGGSTFEQSLEDPEVKKALDALAQRKMDPERLKYWLREIETAADKYPASRDDRRKARQLASKAKSLAHAIERASETHPISLMATGPETWEMLALPGRLRMYANMWETNLSMPTVRGAGPRSEQIVGLLHMVKWHTGTYHYSEVADLLNAMEVAVGRKGSGPRWDATSLKQLQYRARKRLKTILNA